MTVRLGTRVPDISVGLGAAILSGGGGGTPPTITTASINALTVGEAFTQTLTATGDATITWSVSAGSLPAGLSLSSGGVLSGTPTTAGAYDFTAQATNDSGSDTQNYTGSVAAVMPDTALWLPGGVTGEYISTPNHASLNIAGDFSFIFHMGRDDWATVGNVLSRRIPAETNPPFVQLTASTVPVLTGANASASLISFTCSAALSVSNGDSIWWGITFDSNVGGTNSLARFWTSSDGITWSQLGTDQTDADLGPYDYQTGNPLLLGWNGSVGSSNYDQFTWHYAAVYDGIGANTAPGQGTLVAEADFSHLWVGNRYTDSTGKVWTINGSAWAWEIPE